MASERHKHVRRPANSRQLLTNTSSGFIHPVFLINTADNALSTFFVELCSKVSFRTFCKSLGVRGWESFPVHCPLCFLTAKVGSLESSDPSIPDIFDKMLNSKKNLQLVTGGYKQNPRMLHVKCGTGKNKQIYKIEGKKSSLKSELIKTNSGVKDVTPLPTGLGAPLG